MASSLDSIIRSHSSHQDFGMGLISNLISPIDTKSHREVKLVWFMSLERTVDLQRSAQILVVYFSVPAPLSLATTHLTPHSHDCVSLSVTEERCHHLPLSLMEISCYLLFWACLPSKTKHLFLTSPWLSFNFISSSSNSALLLVGPLISCHDFPLMRFFTCGNLGITPKAQRNSFSTQLSKTALHYWGVRVQTEDYWTEGQRNTWKYRGRRSPPSTSSHSGRFWGIWNDCHLGGQHAQN